MRGRRRGMLRRTLSARLLPTDQTVGARPHAAADKHRLSHRTQDFGQARMPRSESPRRTLAMDKQLPLLAVNGVHSTLQVLWETS